MPTLYTYLWCGDFWLLLTVAPKEWDKSWFLLTSTLLIQWCDHLCCQRHWQRLCMKESIPGTSPTHRRVHFTCEAAASSNKKKKHTTRDSFLSTCPKYPRTKLHIGKVPEVVQGTLYALSPELLALVTRQHSAKILPPKTMLSQQ